MDIHFRVRFSQSRFTIASVSLLAWLVLGLSLVLIAPTVRAATEPAITLNTPVIAYGGSLNLSGTGFTPSERISIWVTAPDQSVTDLGYVYADNTGSLNEVTLGKTLTSGTPGTWAISFRGVESQVVAIARFVLLTPTLRAGALATSPETAVVVYNGDYFAPGERVSLWITDSNGTVLDAGMVFAGDNGSIPAGSQEGFNFAGTPGVYKLTAYGNTSLQTVITTLNVSAF